MIINYGPWLPDQADLGNDGMVDVKNAIPTQKGYLPLPGLSVYSNALTARAQGAFTCKDDDGNVYNFAGDATKLYNLPGGTYTDISKSGGYSTGTEESIEFVRYGNRVIETNWNNYPQSYIMGTDTAFSDLTTDFKCRHLAVVKEFIFAGNTTDSTNGGLSYRIRWSAEGNPTDWTFAASTKSDYQDFPDDGAVQKIIGGEYAVIFQEHAIRVGTQVDGNRIFQFDKMENRGTPAPGSVIALGRFVFYLGWDGFYVFNGERSEPIGAEKIDSWFNDDLDKSYYKRITSAIDPVNHIVVWSYAGTGNSGGTPNRIIIYNWGADKWTYGDVNLELITSYFSPGYTLEQLDAFGTMETLTSSLDSDVWKGGTLTLAGFDTSHRLSNFSGTALSATFESREFQLNPGFKSTLREIRPLTDGGTSTITVDTRNNQADAVTTGSAITQAASGRYATRSTGRYHRVKEVTTGAFNYASGIEVQGIKRGSR